MKSFLFRAALVAATVATASAAHAGGNVRWSVTVGSPGYYYPPVVVQQYAPPPVVVYQQPGYYYAPPVVSSIEPQFQYGAPPTVYVPPPTVTYVYPQGNRHSHQQYHGERYPRQEYGGHRQGGYYSR